MVIDKDFLQCVKTHVYEAGRLVQAAQKKQYDYRQKDDHSFTTDADVDSEAYLIASLTAVVPEAIVVAEETAQTITCSNDSSQYWWVIDPLDGTTNYMHNHPYFSITVALMQGTTICFGCVYAPAMNEYFHAVAGGGAYCNDFPIRVINRDSKALPMTVATGGPSQEPYRSDYQYRFNALATHIKSTRKHGSAALDLAYVAMGRLDAAFFGKLSWWDIAAGVLLVREAGGVVSDLGTDLITPGFYFCLAGHKKIHTYLQTFL